jgi:hypothetical protein
MQQQPHQTTMLTLRQAPMGLRVTASPISFYSLLPYLQAFP